MHNSKHQEQLTSMAVYRTHINSGMKPLRYKGALAYYPANAPIRTVDGQASAQAGRETPTARAHKNHDVAESKTTRTLGDHAVVILCIPPNRFMFCSRTSGRDFPAK